MKRDNILASVQSDRSLNLPVDAVHHEGPPLDLCANFSVDEVLLADRPGVNVIDFIDNKVTSVKSHGIAGQLQAMYDTIIEGIPIDSVELWAMYERILLVPYSNKNRALWLNRLGDIYLGGSQISGTLDVLHQAVLAYKDAVRDDPQTPSHLGDLGVSLLERFRRLGRTTDINQSVSMYEGAARLIPDSHSDKPLYLYNLGNSLVWRFECLGDITDINEAVSTLEAAIMLAPEDHPHQPSILTRLGSSLRYRFEWLGNLTDINLSVEHLQTTVRLTPDGHPTKPSYLNNLGNSLLSRFKRLRDLTDIHQSVAMLEGAVSLIHDDHQHKPSHLGDLGNSLLHRFEHLGDLADIHRSVSVCDHALTLISDDHPAKSSRLRNLGNSLLTRFECLGALTDIDRSVTIFEAAARLTPDGHPDKASHLNNHGNSLLTRFLRLGNLVDIDQSVSKYEAAIALTSDSHPAKPSWLSNHGNSLLRRFLHLGHVADLHQSIFKFEAAVGLTPDGHQNKPSQLSNLANSLATRFEHLGDLADIHQSVSMYEVALKLTPDGHTDKPSRLGNLGTSLRYRFDRLGDLSDIKQSVMYLEAAVLLTPDSHPQKHGLLTFLGNSLLSHFQHGGDMINLHQAISNFEAAVDLTPEMHPDKAAWLTNLGSCLASRFDQLGNLADIHRAVSLFEVAVKLTPDGHPNKAARLKNLGLSLRSRFEQLQDPHDGEEMMLHFIHAASSPTGPVHIRFQACRLWAMEAHVVQHPSLLNAYTMVIELLPQLASLGLSLTDRHHLIKEAGQVVRDAAAAAIAAHRFTMAVEWLEQGRSVIWGQILSLRTPVDELRKSHPVLADNLLSLSTLLETAGTRSSAAEAPDLQSVAQQSHVLAAERVQVLEQIRDLPGFERFLLPKLISELSVAAQIGPVVLLNISQYRCDALILTPNPGDQVIHVPLDCTLEAAQSLAESLGSLVRGAARSSRLHGRREGELPPEVEFSRVLSELWKRIVKPVLEGLAVPTPPTVAPGRIWWCPTGPLAFLPIHAAGLYGTNEAFGSKLSDFYIPSYTPSLAVLIECFNVRHESLEGLQILAVAQPSAHGQDYIPGTQDEIEHIERLAKGIVPVLRLDRDTATVDSVQDGMKKSRWAHFACHGVQDTFNPTDSALLLAGKSRLTLSSIIQLSLPCADLAFLSACQTATGSRDLEDESVHLTAGMLLAGYRGVIGTMWSIMDKDAPQVAGDVYAHLFKTSPLDPTRAAEALHLAVRRLREQGGGNKPFAHWVPFIHVGV
ncbi:TPR-like protein [Mycena latifolia]|nr:TPR-like protein [Mycena latifolia]